MWLQHATRVLIPAGRWFFRGSRVVGGDRVPPEGPVLAAFNHASFLDPWFVGMLFPRLPIRFLITEQWYWRNRFWTAFFAGYGTIPTSERRPAETILRVVDALARGELVGIFPEGRISHDGRMNEVRHGVGWIAALSGAPVLPCGLRGDYAALPRQRRFPRRHPVELFVGRPLRFPGGPVARPAPAAVHAFTCEVAAEIARLAGQEDRVDAVLPPREPRDIVPLLGRAREAILARPAR